MNRLAFASPLSFLARTTFRSAKSVMVFSRNVREVRAEKPVRTRFHLLPTATTTSTGAAEAEVDPGAIAGTDLRILKYPHPLLRQANREYKLPEEAEEARRASKEMLKVMYASRGCGLAAPQVGINRRLMVFNVTADPKKWTHETILVNPRIVSVSKATEVAGEACLSFPNMGGPVTRSLTVKVEAQRLNGKSFRIKYEGWKARVFQHEYDHLDGVLYVDRIAKDDRTDDIKTRLASLVQDYQNDPFEGRPAAL